MENSLEIQNSQDIKYKPSRSAYGREMCEDNGDDLIQYLWIIEKQTSKLIFYHHCNKDLQLDGVLISGLLSALNHFSEFELEEQGIENIDMGGLRWVYSYSLPCNLMVVGAGPKTGNAKLMLSRLDVIKRMFIKTYQITPDFWKSWSSNINPFKNFVDVLDLLKAQWIQANQMMDLGDIFDILGIFQQIFIIFIRIIKTQFSQKSYSQILIKLSHYSLELNNWLHSQDDQIYLQISELYLPKISIEENSIQFDKMKATNIFSKDLVGLDQENLILVFKNVFEIYKNVISDRLGRLAWLDIFNREIKPYLFSQWSYLSQFNLVQSFLELFLQV
ncbi:hypothetical protein NEF87_002131 [Candidatus Lokiarchaeum ossiferum]|uniref:Uncharacterized protein n=1 Tax=Candidatus Lokiarchaeum ossiferum TaxID=2951803 RepID=A0ABY6HQZ7_9ARCH|nr:hypothetical protein NEF87_002131 [Candidatus Lokiarchaeum sp. B-35]